MNRRGFLAALGVSLCAPKALGRALAERMPLPVTGTGGAAFEARSLLGIPVLLSAFCPRDQAIQIRGRAELFMHPATWERITPLLAELKVVQADIEAAQARMSWPRVSA